MKTTGFPAATDSGVLRFRVQNVVAVARVADTLPLAELAATIPGVEYPKKNYPGLLLRIPAPRVACRVYDSGKCVLTGLTAVDHLQAALGAVVELLRAAGAELLEPVPAARVTNLVASAHLGEGVALFRLALALNLERVEYDPELSAALIFRARRGGTALVFASGALVVMGARSVEQARAVAAEVRDVVDAMGAWRSYI
jgi:transcription initiation factor TFIID TATA-box-binding protein